MVAILVDYFEWCRDRVGVLQDSTVKGGCGTWLESSDYISPGMHPGSIASLQWWEKCHCS